MHLDGAFLLISMLLGWFGKAFTSTYLLDETFTLAKARIGGKEAVWLADEIIRSKKIVTLKVEERDDISGLAMEKFRKYSSVKGISFTDCTSLSLMKSLDIECLLSFERNFKPLVPKLIGEGYRRSLTDEQMRLLSQVAKKLGINIQ